VWYSRMMVWGSACILVALSLRFPAVQILHFSSTHHFIITGISRILGHEYGDIHLVGTAYTKDSTKAKVWHFGVS
jgi:hypothetical protein